MEDIVSKALREAEKLEPEELEELKSDFSKYEALKSFIRKVAEEDKRIAAAVEDKIETGDEEGIELELSKICSTKKLKMIKESLEAETFHMYIAKIGGVDTVRTMSNGMEVFPTIQIESVADVERAHYLQWGSILVECVFLLLECANIRLHLSNTLRRKACEKAAKWLKTPAMRRACRALESAWKSSSRNLARARAIFEFVKEAYIHKMLWNLIRFMCQDMSPADWAWAAAALAASVIASFSTGGAALIAKIVLALSKAYSLSKKINNLSHLSCIREKLEAQEPDRFVL